MIKKYKNDSVTWIDVLEPTKEDIRVLMDEYGIDPLIASELQLPAYKEKIITNKDYLYLSLHFPALRHTHIDKTDQEIDFVIGKDFIITNRYESIDALERFIKTFEYDNIIRKGQMGGHAGYVFYYMLSELYKAMSDEADSLTDTLEDIDKNIFKGEEKQMVSRISVVSRDLISFHHIITTHKEVLLPLKEFSSKLFDKNFTTNISRIITEYHRIERELVNNLDFVRELRDTNDSLLSLKQNESIKILNFLIFLSIPLSLIENLFSMNTKSTPISGMANDWFIILGIQIIIALGIYMLSKWKKWI